MQNVAIRMEGGLGDHLLANRFAAAIREKHPTSFITLFSDTEGNNSSANLLKYFFPSFYNKLEIIPYRKNKNHQIASQFGIETYPADINNLPDDFIEKFKKADRFYDLHIDSLNWLNQDFDWLRYYYFFPKPEKINSTEYKTPSDNYILCHLYSRPDSPYNLDKNYVIELINNLKQILDVVIITQEEHKAYYQEVFNLNGVHITTPNLKECFYLASKCKSFIGIDSGIRYMPYHFSKPVFVFSKYCNSYGSVAPSHLIRWLLFEKNVFPVNFDTHIVASIINNNLLNPASALFPEYLSNVNSAIINRKF